MLPSDVPKLRDKFNENDVEHYEGDIKFPYRFLIDKDIKGSLDIGGYYEAGEHVDRVYKEPELKSAEFIPKLKIASIDIETNSKTEDLYCVSIYSENFKKVFIISNKKLNNAVNCRDEEDLVEKFKEKILELDPDIITGWNLIDFDLAVLEKKFRKYHIPFVLGRDNSRCKLKLENNFMISSKADFPGRMVLDGLALLKNSFIKLEDYKLETASKIFLKDNKLLNSENTHIEKHLEIDRLFKEEQQGLVDYNLKDSELVYRILYESKALELTIQRSLLTGMPLDRVSASIASLDSLYIREARKRKVAVPSGKYNIKEKPILGGFVRESEPGIYDYILVLDFKSLYPSLIRTFNIDPYSFVKDCKGKNLVKAPNGACFRNEEGILSSVIQKLWEAREKTRKEKNELARHAIKIHMNSIFGSMASPSCRFFNLDIGNAITHFGQFILKLTANEIEKLGYHVVYGDSVSGDTEVIIQGENKELHFTKIRSLFNKIKKSGIEGKEYDFPKKMCVLTLDSTGKSIFKQIRYVMRHKTKKKMYRVYFTNTSFIDVTEDHSLIGYINASHKSNSKPIERLIEVKPCNIGNKINSIICLKKIPRNIINKKDYPKEVYEFMGYFIGDGCFFKNKSHKDYYLKISSGIDQKEVISRLIKPLKNSGYIKNFWVSKSRKGDITVNGLRLVKLISKELKNNDDKAIPKWFYEESEESICSFLRGLFSADGTVIFRHNNPIVRLTNTKKDIIQDVRRLLYFVGIPNSCFTENKPNKYKGKISKTYSSHIIIKDIIAFKRKVGFILPRKQKRLNNIKKHKTKKNYYDLDFDLFKVIKIKEIKNQSYVYDLEVDDYHRFFANNALVHNTDSNFVVSKAKNLEEANKIGKRLQDEINIFYKNYVKKNYSRESFLELSFDKCFIKCLMPKVRGTEKGAKKRYAGLVIEDGKERIDFTGLEMVRADWTNLAKKFQLELLDKVFHDKEVNAYIIKFVKDLKNGKYDDLLVYRKKLRKAISEYAVQAQHKKVADIIIKHAGFLESNIIEYVMTEEGPEPIKYKKHEIDYDYYVKKQILPIIEQIAQFYNINIELLKVKKGQTSLDNF